MEVVAVVGSRGFDDYGYLCEKLDSLGPFAGVVSGGARGADALGRRYAEDRGLPYQEFPAEWAKYGRSAGFRRNVLIVGAADLVVAFWDGQSRGTRHTMDQAYQQGKRLIVVRYGRQE